MKFAHNAKSIKQHVKENIFLKDLDENIQNQVHCICKKNSKNKLGDNSFDSDDLIELSKFYEKDENFHLIKSELEHKKSHSKCKVPESQQMLKSLFQKTLEKLKKYKNDKKSMQEKIIDL